MPVYAYKGVNQSGKRSRGTISADSPRAARSRMRSSGIYVTEIAEAGGSPERSTPSIAEDGESSRWNVQIRLPSRIPGMDRAVATRQLATLLSAGIPLVEALGALIEQTENSALRSAFQQARDRVNEGASLADAFRSTGRFDSLYESMIRAGEASGALDTVLSRIADYLEEQVRLSNKVLSILAYPIFMLLFTGVVVVVTVTVVLPQITGLLLSLDQELPFLTRLVISGSDFLRSYWWTLLLGVAALLFVIRAVRRTERGALAWDRMMLKLPVFGKIIRLVAIARFTRTLGSLLASGVNIVQSLGIAQNVARNHVLAQAIDAARESILEGASLAAPLRQSREFPPMVTTMVEVGERSGDLEDMLGRVANTYDEQVEAAVGRITGLLEPVLILVMVGIVLILIMAILSPLMGITQSIR